MNPKEEIQNFEMSGARSGAVSMMVRKSKDKRQQESLLAAFEVKEHIYPKTLKNSAGGQCKLSVVFKGCQYFK